MKKALLVILLMSLVACAATGPAEDQWDLEEKEDKIDIGNIFKSKDKADAEANQKENEELRARIEKLEQQTSDQQASDQQQDAAPANTESVGSDITAPPSIGAQTNQRRRDAQPGDTVSYQEWLRAKEGNSKEYQEFKEYQEWLEFKRQQQGK